MIPIDEFQSWGKEELYFCTTCFHNKWLSPNDTNYQILGDVEKFAMSEELQKQIDKVLANEKKSEKKVLKNSLFILIGFALIVLLFVLIG